VKEGGSESLMGNENEKEKEKESKGKDGEKEPQPQGQRQDEGSDGKKDADALNNPTPLQDATNTQNKD